MPGSQIDNQAGVSLIPQLHYILQRGGCAKLCTAVLKGAPGSKSQTGTQLVSPATGPEKKSWTPLEHNFKTVFTKYLEYSSIW